MMNMGTPWIKMGELTSEGLVMASIICEQVSFKRGGKWDQVYDWYINDGGSVSMTRYCMDQTFSLEKHMMMPERSIPAFKSAEAPVGNVVARCICLGFRV
jgi:hypothetical protein